MVTQCYSSMTRQALKAEAWSDQRQQAAIMMTHEQALALPVSVSVSDNLRESCKTAFSIDTN